MDLFWSASALLLGHVLYGLPSRSTRPAVRVSLHNGDGFSSADLGPRPDRLHAVRAVVAGRSRPLIASGTPETGVYVDAEGVEAPGWVVVETRPTFIELAPASFDRYLAHEGLAHVRDARALAGDDGRPGREVYTKFVKTAVSHVDGRVHFPTAPVGLPIELVPLHPAPLVTGDVLEIRVLVDGHPAAGVQVRAHHRASPTDPPRDAACLRTDGDGRVAMVLDGPGLWRLHAIAMAAHDDLTVADWHSLWASLTFRLDSPEMP